MKLILLIGILFSAGAIAEKKCAVYLPPECLEVVNTRVRSTDHRLSYNEAQASNFSLIRDIEVEVQCKIDPPTRDTQEIIAKPHFKTYLFSTEVSENSVFPISVMFVYWHRNTADLRCE